MIKFRPLKEDEIDVRVAQCKESYITLLLYKDARCDMNILDESVGIMNWQRHHSRENANCIVSIWDEEKKQWIEKEDTGIESNTQKEKGLASDSFKRACFNLGIGRELYTSPIIKIWCKDTKGNVIVNVEDSTRKDQYGKPIYVTYDTFSVSKIGYNENKVIVYLKIVNQDNKVVFIYENKEEIERLKELKKESGKENEINNN